MIFRLGVARVSVRYVATRCAYACFVWRADAPELRELVWVDETVYDEPRESVEAMGRVADAAYLMSHASKGRVLPRRHRVASEKWRANSGGG